MFTRASPEILNHLKAQRFGGAKNFRSHCLHVVISMMTLFLLESFIDLPKATQQTMSI